MKYLRGETNQISDVLDVFISLEDSVNIKYRKTF